jgi:hypothetical protein
MTRRMKAGSSIPTIFSAPMPGRGAPGRPGRRARTQTAEELDEEIAKAQSVLPDGAELLGPPERR